jgi:uncharacterized protein with HEPN domain
MQPRALKYILDIQSLILEIESFVELTGHDFFRYRSQPIVKRAIERDLEIIGEAVRQIQITHPELQISSSKKIIGLRNLLAHAYDSIDDELIWSIVRRDLPQLKREIDLLLNDAFPQSAESEG